MTLLSSKVRRDKNSNVAIRISHFRRDTFTEPDQMLQCVFHLSEVVRDTFYPS